MKPEDKRVKNILFDLDGTIIDSYPGIQAAFNHAYELMYKAPCLHDVRAFVGPPIKVIFAQISGEADPEKAILFAEHFQREYDALHFQKSDLYPGIKDLLQQLTDRGLGLYIATNKRIHPTNLILNYLNISHYFKAVYSNDSRQPSYTSKIEMVAEILRAEGLEASGTVLVGDTVHDQEAAVENRVAFIYADYGFGDLSGVDKTISEALHTLNYIV